MNMHLDYISQFSFVTNDIMHPYSSENKDEYINYIKESLTKLSSVLSDGIYTRSFIYNISEVYESTNTVILTLECIYDNESLISEKQIIVK